jgi:hypothetical protein
MAKKSVTIEEPIEDVAIEATEPTVEPVDLLANGWPSRDFFTPIPGITEPIAAAVAEEAPVVEEAAAQDGGQEQA